ncbi:MAG: potassium transporter TrkA [Desulfobacteraceae bacterium]|nr:MAG: potassium transporter TrkA [Desulfobacteraceae bacterium]
MQIKTSDLPGIGKRYSFQMAEGGQLVMILHHDGQREIYHFKDPDQDEPDFTIKMTDEESRQIASILLGVDYQPVADDKIELLLKNVRMDWIKVSPESFIANKKIIESQIRTKTGATVVAIQRGEKIIGSPDINEVIKPGDTLMTIGTRDQTRLLENLCRT